MTILIAPSILSADLANLAAELKRAEQGKADWLDVGVMDGHFAGKISVGAPVVKSMRKCTSLPIDVHLMVAKPDSLLQDFVDAGASCLTVHVESCLHLQRTLSHIRTLGLKAGAALNPATSPEVLQYVLNDVDVVRIMSVNPGFGSQTFNRAVIPKIAAVRKMLDEAGNANALIAIDGGITEDLAAEVAAAGANFFVAGKSVFAAADLGAAVQKLRDKALSGVKNLHPV